MSSFEENLIQKIKVLNDTIWEQRATRPRVESWLTNFAPPVPSLPDERLHALYLLSNFIYFGDREMREMLKSMFRDKYKYSIVEEIRRSHSDTTDQSFIHGAFSREMERTRFLGVGNPSESGCHLLYYFRQENELPKTLFIHTHNIFRRRGDPNGVALRDPTIARYVFIDDFCGSGHQATEYSEEVVSDLKRLKPDAHVSYYVLFATEEGIRFIRENAKFDAVDCIYELDASFKCFDPHSRYVPTHRVGDEAPLIDWAFAEQMCRVYGKRLFPEHPLGYGDCQLLIGFHHNTPDNTLPIFWREEATSQGWTPIFKRYDKKYGW